MSGEDLRSLWASLEAEAAAPPPLPEGWVPWKQPSDPTPIDRFVTSLIEKRRPPRIDPQRQYPFACPYHFVRSQLARIKWGVDQTAEKITRLVQQRGEAGERHVKAAEKLRAALDAVSAAVADLDLSEREVSYPLGEDHGIVGGFGDHEELAGHVLVARHALSAAVLHADLLRHTLKSKPADFHRRAFLACAGKIYRLLTNRRPAAGDGPFPQFAALAYTYLWPERDPGDFNRLSRDIDFSHLEIFFER